MRCKIFQMHICTPYIIILVQVSYFVYGPLLTITSISRWINTNHYSFNILKFMLSLDSQYSGFNMYEEYIVILRVVFDSRYVFLKPHIYP